MQEGKYQQENIQFTYMLHIHSTHIYMLVE